jgi:thioredoxin reductase (NADPH)
MMDCLIIGGGPAGLTAAVYLARFRRRVVLVDSRASRAALIPRSHNYPGAPKGMAGEDMLENLRVQAREYGADLREGTVTNLARKGDHFTAAVKDGPDISARKIILATGIVDEKPALPRMPEFIYSGAVRFCPICDGYEATDRRIAVLGPAHTAIKKALFLRSYSADITVLSLDAASVTPEEARWLAEAGLAGPARIRDLYAQGDKIAAELEDGRALDFDILYPAMGAHVRSELAIELGAGHTEDGCVCTSDHCETSVPGLYAIGDVSTELHQISVAYGHAAIAATHVHNSLERNFR